MPGVNIYVSCLCFFLWLSLNPVEIYFDAGLARWANCSECDFFTLPHIVFRTLNIFNLWQISSFLQSRYISFPESKLCIYVCISPFISVLLLSTVHNGVDWSKFLDHVNLILRALKKSERSVLSFVRYIKKCFYFLSLTSSRGTNCRKSSILQYAHASSQDKSSTTGRSRGVNISLTIST